MDKEETPKRKPGRPLGSKGQVSLRLVPKTGMQPAIAKRLAASLSGPDATSPRRSGALSDPDATSPHRSGALSDTSNPGPEKATPSTPAGRKPTKERGSVIPHLGITEKQEAFCQAVCSGKNLSDAYRAAYVADNMADSSIHVAASRLYSDTKIRLRLETINAELDADRRMMARSDAALALRVLRLMAESADTDASKIRAAELLAKVGGLFVEQVDISDKRERPVEEIEAAIKAKLSRLGLTG